MQFTKSDTVYIIKIEKGEEVLSTLSTFCGEQGIPNAYFTGIGAAQGLSCGYCALDEKKYYFTNYPELVEVVSLSGNIFLKEGTPFVHAHGVFTDTKNQAFGGHIEKITSGIVIEVVLTVLPTSLQRTYDEEIGLYLFNCRE